MKEGGRSGEKKRLGVKSSKYEGSGIVYKDGSKSVGIDFAEMISRKTGVGPGNIYRL